MVQFVTLAKEAQLIRKVMFDSLKGAMKNVILLHRLVLKCLCLLPQRNNE